MEAELLRLILIFLCLLLFIIAGIIYGIKALFRRIPSFSPDEEDEMDSPLSPPDTYGQFKMVNEVEGVLSYENKLVRTYTTGVLALGEDETVAVDIYEGQEVHVIDIYYLENSMYVKLPHHMDYASKAVECIGALREIARKGGIDYALVKDVESIVMDINRLNELVRDGAVAKLKNGNYAFR